MYWENCWTVSWQRECEHLTRLGKLLDSFLTNKVWTSHKAWKTAGQLPVKQCEHLTKLGKLLYSFLANRVWTSHKAWKIAGQLPGKLCEHLTRLRKLLDSFLANSVNISQDLENCWTASWQTECEHLTRLGKQIFCHSPLQIALSLWEETADLLQLVPTIRPATSRESIALSPFSSNRIKPQIG